MRVKYVMLASYTQEPIQFRKHAEAMGTRIPILEVRKLRFGEADMAGQRSH